MTTKTSAYQLVGRGWVEIFYVYIAIVCKIKRKSDKYIVFTFHFQKNHYL